MSIDLRFLIPLLLAALTGCPLVGCAMDEADLRVRQSFAEHVEQFAGVAVPAYQKIAQKGWDSNHEVRRQLVGNAWQQYVERNTDADGKVSVQASELLAEVANRDAALLQIADSASRWREVDQQFTSVVESFRQTNRDLAAEELDVYERRKSVEASVRVGMEATVGMLSAAAILFVP